MNKTYEYRSVKIATIWLLIAIGVALIAWGFDRYSASGKALPQASNSVQNFIPTPAAQVAKSQSVIYRLISDVPAIGETLAGCTITDKQYVICEDGEKIIYLDKSLFVYVDGQWTLQR